LLAAKREASGAARATLTLVDSEETRAVWPHAFRLELTVLVTGRTLEMNLAVMNTDQTAFEFTGALHTYLRVADIRQTVLAGLQNVRYRDKGLGADDIVESDPVLHIDREIDRIYYAAPDLLEVREPDRTTVVRASGFRDTVVWNPAERGAALNDLEAGGYLRMLCVEAAAARAPITVDAGAQWMGSQILTAR
jgi:glucose-6-phosphate 1-epimerase